MYVVKPRKTHAVHFILFFSVGRSFTTVWEFFANRTSSPKEVRFAVATGSAGAVSTQCEA